MTTYALRILVPERPVRPGLYLPLPCGLTLGIPLSLALWALIITVIVRMT